MYRLLVAVACSQALQPRPQKTLDVKRRDLLPLAGFLFTPAANAATSAELKAMMGGLQSELSDENLAKARGVAQKDDGGGFGDFGAAQREAGRKRAEAMRNRAFSPERERAAMEAREEQRKFNRLTAQEQAKYRAAGKAPKG